MKEKNLKALKNNSNLYKFEQTFWQNKQIVCGVDEVGRGCLAGPIVTAAVILHPSAVHENIQDSKNLNSKQLQLLYNWIIHNSYYAIGISNSRTIDEKNIYTTTQLTMKKAIFHLLQTTPKMPDIIAIDAMPITLDKTHYQDIAITSFIKGESKSACIAAASIIAKVTRDKILQQLDAYFPAYHLGQHKGYGTALHIKQLQTFKPTVIHRTTFIKNFMKETDEQLTQQSLF
ncbi:MAG: ribonuclease HII [Candidatus Chromulinivorax sp.]